MNNNAKVAEAKRRPIRAANMQRLRVARGLTAAQMSEVCGIYPSFILEMENGLRSISIRTIDRLADGLCMDPSDVLSELDRRIGR